MLFVSDLSDLPHLNYISEHSLLQAGVELGFGFMGRNREVPTVWG